MEQYQWAVNRVEELLPLVDDSTPLDDANCVELEKLSNLVADYSDLHFAIDTPTLSEILKLRMEEMVLSVAKLTLGGVLRLISLISRWIPVRQ